MSIHEELLELTKLHDSGALTDAEFSVAKERVLSRSQDPNETLGQGVSDDELQQESKKGIGVLGCFLLALGVLIGIPVLLVLGGTFSTVFVPKVLDRLSNAKTGKAKADLPAIAQALDQYMISNGRFPNSLEDLVRPDDNGRQFLIQKTVPKDPWGVEYEYLAPSGGSSEYELRTLGRDGKPGGEGEDRDLTYAMIRDQEI